MKTNEEKDEVFVVISIADNGQVHAWGTPEGNLFQSRKAAVNASLRFKRYNRKMYPDHEIRISVCKLLEGG